MVFVLLLYIIMCVLCMFVCASFSAGPLPTFHAAKLRCLSVADVRSCALRCAGGNNLWAFMFYPQHECP